MQKWALNRSSQVTKLDQNSLKLLTYPKRVSLIFSRSWSLSGLICCLILWRSSSFAKSQLSLLVCDFDDSFIAYTITHYISPTPIATSFKLFKNTHSRHSYVSREDITEDTQPLPPQMPANSTNNIPISLCKGKHTCTYQISSYVFSCLLSSSSKSLLVAQILFIFINLV